MGNLKVPAQNLAGPPAPMSPGGRRGRVRDKKVSTEVKTAPPKKETTPQELNTNLEAMSDFYGDKGSAFTNVTEKPSSIQGEGAEVNVKKEEKEDAKPTASMAGKGGVLALKEKSKKVSTVNGTTITEENTGGSAKTKAERDLSKDTTLTAEIKADRKVDGTTASKAQAKIKKVEEEDGVKVSLEAGVEGNATEEKSKVGAGIKLNIQQEAVKDTLYLNTSTVVEGHHGSGGPGISARAGVEGQLYLHKKDVYLYAGGGLQVGADGKGSHVDPYLGAGVGANISGLGNFKIGGIINPATGDAGLDR